MGTHVLLRSGTQRDDIELTILRQLPTQDRATLHFISGICQLRSCIRTHFGGGLALNLPARKYRGEPWHMSC